MGFFTPKLSNKKYNRFMRMGSKRASKYFSGRRFAREVAISRKSARNVASTHKTIMGLFGF